MIPLKDENPTTRTPFITVFIIVACIAVYFGPQQGLTDEAQALAFNLEYAAIPCELSTGESLSTAEVRATFLDGDFNACQDGESSPEFFPDKIVYLGALTSIFLHGGLLHLLGNMWSLWIFGNNIEDRLGHTRYVLFYLMGGVVAMMAHFMAQPSSTIPVVGASGAIAAIMGAYLIWFPNAPIRTLILYFVQHISAKWFLGIWFVMQFFTGSDSGVAWVAHVGGFVFGVAIALIVRISEFGRRQVNRSPQRGRWDYTTGTGSGPPPYRFDDRWSGGWPDRH